MTVLLKILICFH